MIHNRMLYDPILGQGQGHGGLKRAKVADFKAFLLCWYACNQTLMANYDTPRQYLNFCWTDFLYCFLFGIA